MVEGAFGHCDKALSELQQQSYAATAASSSGHVPTDGPSIGPIRARLHEMARADLIRDNILADLDTRLVSLAYSQCDADQKMAAWAGEINTSLGSVRDAGQTTLAR